MNDKGLKLGMGFSKRVVLTLAVLLCLYIIFYFFCYPNIKYKPWWSVSKIALFKAETSTPARDRFTPAARTPAVASPGTTRSQTLHKASTAGSRKTTKAPRPRGTTEFSYIGDRYATDDVPSQTSCANSTRKRVKGTTFKERFLEHVPVLQWHKHGSPEEYKRLRQYPGAHGWGSVDYETLMNTLSILNTSANRLMFDDWERRANGSSCIRCAVVGNGGILNGSKKGREIDRHDYVFRTNGAVINGFEEDVGSRTTMYTFSANTLRNSIASYGAVGYKGPPLSEETRYVFLPDHDRDYILLKAAATHTPIKKGPESSKIPPRYFGDNVTLEKFKMYHPDFIRYIRNRFLRSNIMKTEYRNIYRPSTGAVMLLAALHTCDQVSAYGFMTPDYSKYSDHYYDKRHRGVTFYANHDLHLELYLWQQLHKEGLIRLYMR
ncbi:alpha-N-acetylgalactosaminide alpha-2,6-sialyltransferase 2 [Scleropages formosus]|uniref:alpha-N-acetylgalactosaminide alpha-2,6-sialyltransferase n=1 Tax=Scleropages formosus TaxID=113540 RepID=A0A8D0CF87_SCLFO|nr:alpha-N-acetylgalactosaminide alpha-2,6-sialyltransferase 2-like [Scleropages formosus]XP_018600950.1 alpha-N-acetylgalactosaminide alpha-2,6-sialyltransferase 2-like [Scleropages formosus]XP_018600952.1 alpha-N-acetylgalactosaminide alpha-2,6-sialyltransferase 2-like [Scleropages formosus]XP_029106573.1 alpha-N-acetylgalactosaminide alpha-2,6-sialyltransferase 2-like [Scleropages formosus]